MVKNGGSSSLNRPLASVLVLLLGLGLFLSVRWAASSDEFANNDVAGIAYNADLLMQGGVPYRDSVEFKSPGSFFLFAGVFAFVRSLHAVRIVLGLWFLLGALGIWKAAQALYGNTLSSAIATALFLCSVGHFDANYSSWMAVPYIWAFAALLLGLRQGSSLWQVVAGACAIIAFLFKTPAVVLAPAFLVITGWWWRFRSRSANPPSLGPAVHPVRTAGAWLVGGILAATPILLFYAAHGALRDFIRGVFPMGAYAGYVVRPNLWETTVNVLSQLFSFFPASLILATISVAAVAIRPRLSPASIFPPLVFLVCSLGGGGMGGARFYDHYSAQYVGALALLAAHPAGLSGCFVAGRRRWERIGAGALVALLYLVEVFDSLSDRPVRFDFSPERGLNGMTYAKSAGLFIREKTCPGDTIYAWGWDAWPTYFWSGRRSPIPMYKELGLVTSPNTNTQWQPSKRFNLRPGPYAESLLDAFRTKPPAYFVYSTYYVVASGGRSDPLIQFTDLVRVLEQRYVREVAYGTIAVYARIDRARRPPGCSSGDTPIGPDSGAR